MKKLISTSILLFLIGTVDLLAISFRGRVYSRVKEKGEAGLMVMIFETKKFYQTDKDGYFDGEVPAPGSYTFRLLKTAGMMELKKSISGEGEIVNLYTDKREAPKGGINVTGEKEKTVVSRYKVRIDEIKHMPGTFGEALRGLETLPGVIPNPGFGPGANALIIRGADADWNTYYYDDLPIQYPFHWDGLTSVIHNDLIKSIDVYTGAYPAHYGNATGGVIEIETVDDVKKKEAAFQMSLWNTTAMFKTPTFDGKGYLAVAGKIGYLDRTIGQSGLLPEGIRLPRFTDSQVKFVHNLNEKHKLMFINLHASDNFALAFPSKYKNDPTEDRTSAFSGAKVSAGQGFRTTAIRHIFTPGDKLTNKVTLIDYAPEVDYDVQFGAIKGKGHARTGYTGIRQDLNWEALSFMKLDFGSEYRLLNLRAYGDNILVKDPNNRSPNPYNTKDPDFETVPMNDKVIGNYYNVYTTLHFKAGNFAFTPGARYEHFAPTKHSAFGPRGTVSYKFTEVGEGLTVFGGAGEYYRMPLLDPAYNRESGNPDLKFEKAVKTSAGLDQMVTKVYQIKGEVFKNTFSDLIVQDPYISDPVGMNPDRKQWVTRPVIQNRPRNYSNSGTGWSHGYEIMLKKHNKQGSRDWFGWITYTWSQAYRNTNIHTQYEGDNVLMSASEKRMLSQFMKNSKEMIAGFDRTHVINVIYGWRFSENWQVGSRWSYITSPPIAQVIGDDGGKFKNPANEQIYWNPKYSTNPATAEYGNSKRLAPYHRFDIRIDRFQNYEWGHFNWYLDIINVYIRDNQTGEQFDSTKPYSRTNPRASRTFGTLILPGGQIIPFFNVGMEVRF